MILTLELVIFFLLGLFSIKDGGLSNFIVYLPVFLLLQSIAPGFLLLTPVIPLDQLPLLFPLALIFAALIILMFALLHWALMVYFVRYAFQKRSFLATVPLVAYLGLTSVAAVHLALT